MNSKKCKIYRLTLLMAINSLLILSCEKTIYIDIENEPSQVVMNGIMSPNYGLWMNLSRSTNITTDERLSYNPITNATIQYYEDDQLITTIAGTTNGDYYENDFKPEPGHEYRLVVNAPDIPEAETTVQIPNPVPISDMDYEVVMNDNLFYSSDYVYYNFYVTLDFLDPEFEENYYMLSVRYFENGRYLEVPNLDSEDMDFNVYIADGLGILALNDENFNGQTKELQIDFEFGQPEGFLTEIVVYLYSIEESYFDYLKSYSQNFTVLNEDVFFSPVPVMSNIEGGFGVMAAVSSDGRAFGFQF